MKIVVCVKYVPDASADQKFESDLTVDRAAVPGLLSELDEYAVEQSLQIKEKSENPDDVEVVALSIGPAEAADAVRKALQMGADSGVLVSDDTIAGSDALATSKVLAAAISKVAGGHKATSAIPAAPEATWSRIAAISPRSAAQPFIFQLPATRGLRCSAIHAPPITALCFR